MVQVSYPGVYVQEVPSGVRTIAGVGTSTALFVGRAQMGPMFEPVLCLSYADFERAFTGAIEGSDLPRAVRLFFQNGGTRCYVVRIADGAVPAEVALENEAGNAVLRLVAKSAGLVGDTIRARVTYSGARPEATFNLELFRWDVNARGETVQTDLELHSALSMDPGSARFAPAYLTQNSALVDAFDADAALAEAAAAGFSQSGRPVTDANDTAFRDAWQDRIGSASVDGTNRFRINVDGTGFVTADLSGLTFGAAPLDTPANVRANLAGEIENAVNAVLPPGASVTASFVVGPTAPGGDGTALLRLESATGDVQIEPAASGDLAVPLMLGAAQGGLEVALHAPRRPAANGVVFDLDDLVDVAEREQTAFDTITIDGVAIGLGTTLQTNATADARMFLDGYTPTNNANHDGVREKWSVIAAAIDAARALDPAFGWGAEVWGSRLALVPLAGGDNAVGTVATSGADGVDIGPSFHTNVRYYSLGTTGQGAFQAGGVAGNNGLAPTLVDYRAAYTAVEREVDLFNLLVLPTDHDHTDATRASLWSPASTFCAEQRAFLLIDAPTWTTVQEATDPVTGVNALRVGLVNDHSAAYYPRVLIRENGLEVAVGPSGAVAGLMARIDGTRGVWKAPAGTEATLRGVVGLERRLSDAENGVLNPRAINALRVFPNGIVSWGARTLDGDDDFGSEYKYVPVRRLALFMEESLYRGLQWVVFEPNDEPLWAQIRLNVGAFMHGLFRQGAFQGTKPADAYFVKCDRETTTQNDVNLGVVNVWVGFAPLKPAEFVVLSIQQIAGQIQT
jgi:phage tail sheath protein FI